MSLELYAAYLLACLFIVIVPGPTVTLIIPTVCAMARAPDCSTQPVRSSASPS